MLKIDHSAALGAIRTTGALMVGNAFVGIFVLEKRNWLELAALLILGISAIIIASLQTPEQEQQ